MTQELYRILPTTIHNYLTIQKAEKIEVIWGSRGNAWALVAEDEAGRTT
jgi:hypothetical protein